MVQNSQVRIYDPAASVVFLKTRERFGGLSNMAAGFPLKVNGINVRTSEALYQACRFPHMPEVQRRIIDARSPMTAKMRGKPFRNQSRPDWHAVQVKIMRWSLRVKLAQNWREFGALVLASGDRPIVERSRRDDFWGAKDAENGSLVGMNVLGRLLMELREALKADTLESLRVVEPLSIHEFLLLEEPIGTIRADDHIPRPIEVETSEDSVAAAAAPPDERQLSLLEQQTVFLPEPLTAGPVRNFGRSVSEPYPRYRNSGVPWLGPVPAHWKTERAKRLFRKMERTVRECDEVVTCFRDGVVTLRNNRRLRGFTESLAEHGYQGIRQGDLVIHAMDAFAGAVGVSNSDGKGTSVYSVCAPLNKSASTHYYAYCVREMARSLWILALSKGIRERSTDFRFPTFAAQPLPVPPPAEQAAIVRFLDYADRRIRRYIRAKEKLIELLEEQKQAVIHQAVTGCIDVRTGRPYPFYKSSGVEWLGDVPAQWQVLRFGRVMSLTAGYPFKSDNFTQFENDIQLLRGINVAPGRLRWDEVVRWPVVDMDTYSEYQVRVGDIILGMDRPIIGSGIRVAMADENDVPSLLLQRVARIRPAKERLDREFALRILSSRNFLNYLSPIFTGISVPHLSPEQIREFRVALPSIAEQKAIGEYLTRRVKEIQFTVKRAGRQMGLLREYRTRLIAEVVTGKLDVRQVAATLPDNLDDSDALEADFAGEEGGDNSRADCDRRTAVPAMQEEMTP